MRSNSKWCLSCLLVGLATVTLVVAQDSACRYDGNVRYCEDDSGEYVAVSTRASGAAFGSPAAAASRMVIRGALDVLSFTALRDCRMRENVQYCTPVPVGNEIAVATQTSAGETLPTEYADCRSNLQEVHCMTPSGQDVLIHALSSTSHNDQGYRKDEMDNHQDCHTHGGVENCAGASSEHAVCERPDGKYNMPIRIGSLFIVFITSSIAVFGPILLRRFVKNVSTTGIRFTMIKQFGTGVIIATALIHLLTHASLQFSSECLGELGYEATTTAIVMAGAFLTFLVEFLGGRFVMHRRSQHAAAASVSGSSSSSSIAGPGVEKSQSLRTQDDLEMSGQLPSPLVYRGGHGDGIVECEDKLSVWVMEMGIIFHSILIGITTVVAGDSAFKSLLVVIVFHQMFEGLALGSRISTLSTVSTLSKSIMAAVFACITPLGMMIGIIALKDFNGSDKMTILTLGTLDALSAGILIWVGFVEMWSADWVYGDLKRAGLVKTMAAMGSLVAGMVLMALLGKWA